MIRSGKTDMVHGTKRVAAPLLAALVLTVGLGACGHSPGDRAVSGGLLGAGGGAAIGAMTGGSPLVGAAVGAAAGAVAGAVTSPGDVNMGRPLWRRDSRSHPPRHH